MVTLLTFYGYQHQPLQKKGDEEAFPVLFGIWNIEIGVNITSCCRSLRREILNLFAILSLLQLLAAYNGRTWSS